MITKLLTKKEYADHRGCSKAYVSKLIREGKIKLEYGDKIDPEKADTTLGPIKSKSAIGLIIPKNENSEVKANQKAEEISISDALEISASKIIRAATLYEAQQYREVYNALAKKVEYERAIGSLLPREEVERELFESDRIVRDKIQEIPQRICPSLPCSDEVRFAVEQAMKIEINSILQSISHAFRS